MAVYLGTFGRVRLGRKTSEGWLDSVVNPSDVNVTQKRFSFDFDIAYITTGDQIEIRSTNGSDLMWIAASGWPGGARQSAGKWFVNVDELGGIKLYNTLAAALDGQVANAITLSSIATDYPIRVIIQNASRRILGDITSYELNTSRETIDITTLSDQFRQQYSSLMSGSGRISCQWDYKDDCGDGTWETPNYLLQLILRTEVGSEFDADLFLKQATYNPAGSSTSGDSLYYRISGVLTAAAIQFQPGTIVEMSAEFITTGPIRLRADISDVDRLLQENSGKLELNQGDGFIAARPRTT